MADVEGIFGSDAESDNDQRGSPGSRSPGSPAGSASPARSSGSEGGSQHSSPAHSGSPPGSPAGSGSGSAPGSPHSSVSGSPPGSPQPGSGSERGGSPVRSGSGSPPGSPRSGGSGTPPGSPGSRSRSASPAQSGAGSPTRSHSGSPPGSPGSGSARSRSGSRSPSRSRSQSRSRSGSPVSRASGGSGSRASSPGGGAPATPGGSGSEVGSPAGSPARSATPKSAHSGSDSDEEVTGKKKKPQIGSDDEGSGNEENVEATMDDLFGDAGDISSDEDKDEDKTEKAEKKEDSDMGEEMQDAEDRTQPDQEQEEEEEEEPPETRIEVEIPRIITNLSKTVHYVKLPNFLSVETRPYDSANYEDEIDEDEVLDEEGRARLKLKVENTVRWKKLKDEEGNEILDDFNVPMRESNARVVRWSDGSMSLHLGDEIFDVHTMPVQGDFNHLFVRQGTGLQGQSVFKTKLAFRPHSTESFTHRKMTLSLADRTTKTQKVKVLPISGRDPEYCRTEMIKKEEEKLRAAIKRESQQRRTKEKSHSGRMSRGFLEGDDDDDDDEGEISISAIKKQYKQIRKEKPQIYSSDSDDAYDSDREISGAKRLLNAKKGVIVDDDEESTSDTGPKRKKARIVEESDEEGDMDESGEKPDEEEGGGSGGEEEARKSGSEMSE